MRVYGGRGMDRIVKAKFDSCADGQVTGTGLLTRETGRLRLLY